MRFDVHTHAMHPKIADKAVGHLHDHYGITACGNGRVEDLLDREKRAGIDRVVVHVAATAPAQVIPANNWAISLQRGHPEILAFGTLHPAYDDWEAELDRLRHAGIKGLKFHAEFQDFFLDDPALLPLFEAAQEDFVFLLHVGDRLPPDRNPSCPYKVAALVDAFPGARFIAAHMGGYLHWEHALTVLLGKNCWIDTSSTMAFVDDELLARLFAAHPRERILFGSDYPLFDPGSEMEELARRMRLSSADMDELLTNASALLG